MRIILIGFGKVGQSLARILGEEKQRLLDTHGFEPQVTTIVDSRSYVHNENGLDLSNALEAKKKNGTVGKNRTRKIGSVSKIIGMHDAEVVVETTVSNFKDGEPGLSHIKQALSMGKHVVTSNKGPLALAMPALLELASYHHRQLLFSATVGGGTPFLSFASKSLEGLKIQQIHGILNGTTNYILTRMSDNSLSFEKALREAQEKGYAEQDPEKDVGGYDTAAKIVIIANWIMKQNISLKNVQITGITGLKTEQLTQATSSGKKIKLIGRVTESTATVKPEAVPLQDPVCVSGTLNALTFSTEHAGDLTLIGAGAGGEQTASAIVRDLIDVRREYQI